MSQSAIPDSDLDVIILKSSDNAYLRASRALLSFASPALRERIALPAEESKDNLPVIQFAEKSRTLEHLISLCGQKWTKDPIILSISEFGEVMAAAKVYRMDGAMQVIERLLVDSPLLKQESLCCFALGKYFGLEQLAQAAAEHTLSLPLFARPCCSELDHITGGDYRIASEKAQEFLHKIASSDIRNNLNTIPTSSLWGATNPRLSVLPIFKDASADLTIKSSDDVLFRVHKPILSLYAPIFAGMFTLPPVTTDLAEAAATTSTFDIISTVDVSEESETLQQLLQFCYPTPDPEIRSLHGVQAVLEAANKYEIDSIRERIAKGLEAFTDNSTLQVYAIAHRYRLERQVRLAAKQLLQQPLSAKYVAELEFIPASALHQLQDYHLRCQSAASRRFSNDGLSWVRSTRRSSIFVPVNSYIWFACRQCPRGTDVKVKDDRDVQPTKWWSDYMAAVSSALSHVPSYSSCAVSSAKDRALETAVTCSTCRQAQVDIDFAVIVTVYLAEDGFLVLKVISQMSEFQVHVAAEIQAAVDSPVITSISNEAVMKVKLEVVF
ncbi:hypothetical protein HWV62_9475 [Athelia sp. TMB]|nr:hypothetical protein HWV62_9475 [Athelia sp. TMB]